FIQSTLGIVPGWGGGSLLYEKVHSSFAFQWITEGSIYNAKYLYTKGWIHAIATHEDFYDRSSVLASYLKNTPEQMEVLKNQYKQQTLALSLSARMNEEVRSCASLWNSPKHQHAVKEFLEKKERSLNKS